jgi:hypothetical protein
MICDGCEGETGRLRAVGSDWLCKTCLGGNLDRPSVGIVVRGVNKYAPKMTHNEKMHIKTRHIGKDGMVHSHPRYETKDW